MSLLLAFHDKNRAIVASDDREIRFDENGLPVPTDTRVPKFYFAGKHILAICGRNDICVQLGKGLARMMADYPATTIDEFAQTIPTVAKMVFDKRSQTTARDAKFDVLEISVIGFDHRREKIRAFLFSSQNDFAFFESTENPNARIFAMGYYHPSDYDVLNGLTAKMQLAHTMKDPWIAAQLRSAIGVMHSRYPVEVGPASYFAALNRIGFKELPFDFPPLPTTEAERTPQFFGAHHVSLTKEGAQGGTTTFFLGSIMTPAAGGQNTIGNNDGGVAGAPGMLNIFQLKVNSSTATGVGASITSPNYSCDSNTTTACVLGLAGPSASDVIILSPVIGLIRRFSSVNLKVLLSVPTNTLSGVDGLTVSYATDGVSYTTILSVAGGTTKPLTTLSVALPLTGNLAQLTVKLNLSAGPSDSGIAGVYLYEVWIEATE